VRNLAAKGFVHILNIPQDFARIPVWVENA